MMTSEAIYTNGTYLAKNPGWHEEDALWKAQQIYNIIRRNRIPVGSVCEVGCGSGAVLQTLWANFRDESCSFDGYDVSPQAIALCRAREAPRLRFHNADVFATGTRYELALALDVFEHVEDYFGFLRKLRTVAKYKVLHIPLDVSVSAVLRPQRLLRTRHSVGHLHYFAKETAACDGDGYGLLHRGLVLHGRFSRAAAEELLEPHC